MFGIKLNVGPLPEKLTFRISDGYGSTVGQGVRLLEKFAMYRQNAATDVSSLRYKDMA